MLKIHILYKFRDNSWGGANQFLKALQSEFKSRGVYADNPEEADVLLFNSYPFSSEYFFDQVFKLKKKYPEKIIIHRLTGPIAMYRKGDKAVDRVIKLFNDSFVDGNIYQSNWCKEQCRKDCDIVSPYQTVILNASDKNLFNKKNKRAFSRSGKIRLVASSWSSSWGKGFDIFQHLDKHLDFSAYEMSFVGNSPIRFKNIKNIPPVSSEKLASILKENDIFVFGSRIEACSNSLIEALSCGLPAVAPNTTSNPEIIGSGGELFEGTDDVLGKIDKVVNNYQKYQNRIPEFNMEDIVEKYYHFAQKIYDNVKKRGYQPKKITLRTQMSFYKTKALILKWKIRKRFK